MKKIILLLITCVAFIATQAQGTFKFGVAGGINVADLSTDQTTKTLTGFHAGLLSEVKFPVKLGVEAGLLYAVKGAKTESFNSNFIDNKLSYIDIPIVVKIYTLKVLSFQLGPQYSYLLSATSDGTDVKDNLNASDISAIAGIGLDVSKFRASIRYNFGLTEISDGGEKNNVIQATVGFWIK